MVELAQNDPYRSMESAKKDMRPGFLGGNGGGEKIAGSDVRNKAAADGLAAAETAAAGANLAEQPENLDNARASEESASGFYSGSGREVATKGRGKVKAKGFLKKGGPIGAIIGLILAVGALMGGSQLMQPFSLLEQFRETFNSMQTSARVRSNSLLRFQLSPTENNTKYKMFDADNFKITSTQAERLRANGIEYEEDYNNTGARVLKYDDGSGNLKIIAADEVSAAKIRASGLDVGDVDTGKMNVEVGTFRDIYDTDASFFKSYNSGSMTWRGAIANWFGSLTDRFISQNNISRNRFKSYAQEVAETGNARTAAVDIIAKGTDEIENGGTKLVTAEEREVKTESGKSETEIVKSTKDGIETSRISRSSDLSDTAKVRSRLNDIAEKYKDNDASGTAQKVVNSACLVMNFMGGVSLLVSGSEALQIINLVTSFFEAIDKVKAGDGDNSPINVLANSLNQPLTTEYEIVESTGKANTDDMNSNISSDEKLKYVNSESTGPITGSAMQSAGITALYSGGRVNPNDPSVKSFNFTSSIKTILGGLGVSMAAFKACSFAKMAANAASVVGSFLEWGACIAGLLGAPFSFGASAAVGCSALVADAVIGAAFTVAISTLISGVVSVISPMFAQAMTRDLITNLAGEDLGNALTSGANMYLGNTHRFNGGALTNQAGYVQFAMAQKDVIAENARYERMVRSPFDASSKYTFLGVLAKQMAKFSSFSSLMSVVSSASNMVSSSLISISPTALADEISEKLYTPDEYANICPYLAEIDAVGDAYCNPYSITDLSTIQDDPTEVVNRISNNFLPGSTDEFNVEIDASSDLAKYILFCDNRTSAFGIVDNNIVSRVSDWGQVDTGSSQLNNVVNSAIGAIPVVGDFIDVVDNGQALANAGYVNGASCVAGNNVRNERSTSVEMEGYEGIEEGEGYAPNWEKAKYYQRFIEDQSLMESMGIIEESAVTAFLNDYYEKNPLDNSYEGILARYSGLSKDDVIALLDIIDYGNYIANYDASSRFAFGEEVKPEEDELIFESENKIATIYYILNNDIVYADLRTRNFVV